MGVETKMPDHCMAHYLVFFLHKTSQVFNIFFINLYSENKRIRKKIFAIKFYVKSV